MENRKSQQYNQNFYQHHQAGMTNSANLVLKFVFDILSKSNYRVNSMLDIGCGRGAWCSVASKFGISKVVGFDGPWVNNNELVEGNFIFSSHDFTNSLPHIFDKYDLTISLEFAEHISPELADDLVKLYCSSADVVLFGAATKNQFGLNHVNEQFPSYWIGKFALNGYKCYDIIRPHFWHNESIEAWYAQNTMLFIKEDIAEFDFQLLNTLSQKLVEVVHPVFFDSRTKVYLEKLWEVKSLNESLEQIKKEYQQLKLDNEIINQELFKANKKCQELALKLNGESVAPDDYEFMKNQINNYQQEFNPYRSKQFK